MKKRRGFVLLLCTAVLAVSLSVSVSAAFSDIPETAWYAPAVEYVQENGIMNGEGEDRFDPEGKMTRAMFVQALYRMTENRDSSFMGLKSFNTVEGLTGQTERRLYLYFHVLL